MTRAGKWKRAWCSRNCKYFDMWGGVRGMLLKMGCTVFEQCVCVWGKVLQTGKKLGNICRNPIISYEIYLMGLGQYLFKQQKTRIENIRYNTCSKILFYKTHAYVGTQSWCKLYVLLRVMVQKVLNHWSSLSFPRGRLSPLDLFNGAPLQDLLSIYSCQDTKRGRLEQICPSFLNTFHTPKSMI